MTLNTTEGGIDFANREPDWSKAPNPERLNVLIEAVRDYDTPITERNFRTWLTDIAFFQLGAACPNGKDHGCNRGLGVWLGIEPYGQFEIVGGERTYYPWDHQQGFSSERLQRFADPAWKAAIIAAPFEVQKRMYIRLLETLRDTGQFVYNTDWPSISEMAPADAMPKTLGEMFDPLPTAARVA